MIKIIVDSASDINKIEADKMNVEMIPLQVTFDKDTYYDGVDLSSKEFYEKLIESDVLPTTSQINPYRFEQVYKKYINEGYELVVITLSSKLSNTYSSAVQASLNYKDKVYVLDSLNVAVGERMLVELALRLVEEGKNVKDIYDELEKAKYKINIIAKLDTLEYLKKGGRISKTVAFVGEMLSLKPVVSLVDGAVKMVGKARGSKKANNLLNELIKEKGEIDFSLPFGAIYSGLSDLEVKKYIEDNAHIWKDKVKEIPIYVVGSTIGTHIGPGALGVAFFSK